jgi:hypothetical protein
VEAINELRKLPSSWAWEGILDPYIGWLGESFTTDPDDDVLPPGCTDSTWILHNQYFCPPELEPLEGWDDDERWPGFGFGAHPPDGWQRLRWAELASRKGASIRGPLFDGVEVPPCYRWEAVLGRNDARYGIPGQALAPTEGSLGKGDLESLIPVLAAGTSSDRIQGAFSFFDQRLNDGTQLAVTFDLTEMLASMLGAEERQFTPEFWWPEDRSWVVWTDWDLMGTKVFGTSSLINQLREHPDVETLDWVKGSET